MVEERLARRLVKAVDTNVVLRLLITDDPAQTAVAERALADPVLVTLTVLLETAWVMGSRFGFSRDTIASVLLRFIDRPVVTVEQPMLVRWAIERFRLVGDFADLIHLVSARSATSFATFDRGVARAAGPDSPIPIETLA